MADIAEYDKNKMKNIALIHTLENEMLHKFKELSSQLADNPGLKPIIDKYRAYLKIKKAEAHAMQHYFQSLLISLYALIPPTNLRPKSKKQKKRGGGGDGGDSGGAFFFNKLVADEQAVMHEIHKWGDQVNLLKEF
jgi:hypothetical protein